MLRFPTSFLPRISRYLSFLLQGNAATDNTHKTKHEAPWEHKALYPLLGNIPIIGDQDEKARESRLALETCFDVASPRILITYSGLNRILNKKLSKLKGACSLVNVTTDQDFRDLLKKSLSGETVILALTARNQLELNRSLSTVKYLLCNQARFVAAVKCLWKTPTLFLLSCFKGEDHQTAQLAHQFDRRFKQVTSELPQDNATRDVLPKELQSDCLNVSSQKSAETGIPVIVPSFNNPSDCERMVNQLTEIGFADITFVDNASTTSKMIECLDLIERQAKVVRLNKNVGPRESVFNPIFFESLPQFFCVTDPDLLFNARLPEDFIQILIRISETHKMGKVGFALDISDNHLFRKRTFKIGDLNTTIYDWEKQFWEHPSGATTEGDTYYAAGIDTTFALYNKQYFELNNFHNAIRVAGRFTAKHLPWYTNAMVSFAEAKTYANSQKFSFYCVPD